MENWWIVKATIHNIGHIAFRNDIFFPKEYVGKKIRLKVEIIKDEIR